MKKLNKYSLAIALFFLRVPTFWYLVLTFMLAQMVLLYLQASSSFLHLNAVECMSSNPDDSLTPNEASSQSNITISDAEPQISGSNSVSNESEASRPVDLNISARVESNTAGVLAGSLNVVAEALNNYAPVVTGTTVVLGAAAAAKSLPANQRLLGMTIGGGIGSFTMLASQYMNQQNRHQNTTIRDNSSNINLDFFDRSDDSEAEQSFNIQETANMTSTESGLDIEEPGSPTTEPYSDMSEPGSPTTDYLFDIDSPLEGFDNLSMMTLAILMINLFIILGLLVILFNYLISQLKLESNKFVLNRPLLLKLLKASEKARSFNNKLIFVFILFGSCSMFYFIFHLLYFLKDLGL